MILVAVNPHSRLREAFAFKTHIAKKQVEDLHIVINGQCILVCASSGIVPRFTQSYIDDKCLLLVNGFHSDQQSDSLVRESA
jgi:hypothetical protein